MQIHTGLVHVVHRNHHTALGLAEIHQRSHIVVGGVDVCIHKRLLRFGNARGVGVGGRIINDFHRAVCQRQAILNAGRGGDEVQVEFPLQPLGDNLHVEKPQKSAAESKSQRGAGLGLKAQ